MDDDEFYEVPRIRIEPQVQVPLIGQAVPRSLAFIALGIVLLLVFLFQEGVPPEVLLWGVLAPSVAAAAAYYMMRPERMTLDRWVGALVEYLLLPPYLVWLPRAPLEEAQARRPGASAVELWGIDDER